MESKVLLWVSVKAFDETDDGFLILKTHVDRNKVKNFTPGSICTLDLTATEEKARERATAYWRAVEHMDQK
ncbi:SLAM family member 7 [Frankliniella fusca]|uniref:SLAM family member 7 n=1 Tax=Frankliniella fusca TaxID=407009 RepID=A0AAE1HDF7_9NEOP|nr:SLAM family member 7 [Frankliniella fusca]